MNMIQPIDAKPGSWQLDGRPLADGDVLEILYASSWCTVLVTYDPFLREYRFTMGEKSLPIFGDTYARLVTTPAAE